MYWGRAIAAIKGSGSQEKNMCIFLITQYKLDKKAQLVSVCTEPKDLG